MKRLSQRAPAPHNEPLVPLREHQALLAHKDAYIAQLLEMQRQRERERRGP